MSRYSHFDPTKYWAGKPFCSICKKKKVKNGNICSDCQKDGHWPTKTIPLNQVSDSESLTDFFTSTQVERGPITDKIKSIAGYLKDCALATMRSYNLDDIRNLKDVSFIPLQELDIEPLRTGNLTINTKEIFSFSYEAKSHEIDRDLLLGSVFLIGEKVKSKDKSIKIFAPLLLVPLTIQINKEGVQFAVKDENIELNNTLFAKLLDTLPEDELEMRLQDVYANIPSWPFTESDLTDFVELINNIFPEAFIYDKENSNKYIQLDEIEVPKNEIKVFHSNALVLSPKKEAEGTIIKELLILAENILDQTGVDNIFCEPNLVQKEESIENPGPPIETKIIEETMWSDLNPMDLSTNKIKIIKEVRTSKLAVITGPPGTGKSFTIQAIILDHLLAGKRVLFVSKMDKAVDVVASGIEKLIGPFAVARSGARSAQKELAEKIEYITGANSPIKKISKNQIELAKLEYDSFQEKIQKLQDDFTRLLTQEREWSKVADMATEYRAKIKSIEKLTHTYVKIEEAEKLKNKVNGADALLRNKGFFIKTWWGSKVISNIQKKLNLPANTPVEEIIATIEVMKNQTERLRIEKEIEKFKELNSIWTEISELKVNIHKKALQVIRDILLGNLYTILYDPIKRPELRKLLQSLKLVNPQQKKILLDQVSSDTLISAFPFWASTTNHLSQFLPLKPGIFDLVIFDEASQCDLASALPALYRANRVIVVGDPKQLNHVVIMSKSIEQSAIVDNKVSSQDRLSYKFSDRSLFDVAMDKVEQRNSFILDEHYRSDPRIITFSSEHFYNGSLRIMTSHPNKTKSQNAIEIRYVDGKRKENSAENPEEIIALFSTLKDLITASGDLPITIGILSPFRDQVNAISKQLPEHITAEQFNKHEIVVGTAHSLQGDEKDVILLSFSIDKDFHHATLRFLETPNVFNVAITRAKKKLIVFSSVTTNDLPNGLLKTFLEYSSKLINDPLPVDHFDSFFEQDVTQNLRNLGLQVWTQYEAAGFKIDLVVGNGEEFIAVECDGPTHFDLEEKAPYHDVWRQEILQRAGWRFVRISYREWAFNKKECINKILNALHLRLVDDPK